MKKRTVFMLAFAAAGILSATSLTSCSQDDEVMSSKSSAKGDPIAFAPVITNADGTRALPTTSANYLTQVKDFKVWGYYDGGTEYYLGKQGKDGIYIIHTSGKSDWTYKTASDFVYWPTSTQTLDFYAVTPSDNDNYSFAGQSLNYVVPADQSKQVDVMLATASKQTKTTNGGKVALNFQHQLSQVVFKGVTKSSNLSVEVKGITIHNIRNNMSIALAGTATQPAAAYSNYAVGLASPVTVNSTSAAKDLTDASGALMLVPQTFNKWSTGSVSAADGTHTTYLEIECKITSKTSSGTTYLVGSANGYGKAYMPLGGTWTAGKKYIYTLKFGVGVSPDNPNTPLTTPITFTVAVSDWTDTPSNVEL